MPSTPPGVLFDEDSARRIAAVVDYVESQMRNGFGRSTAVLSYNQPVFVLTTSGTPDGAGNYPAVLTRYNSDTPDWEDGTDAVVVSDPNGTALADATIYAAVPSGADASDVPLYLVLGKLTSGSGTTIAVQEVDGSPSFPAASTFYVDQTTGMRLVSNGGEPELEGVAASASTVGYVTTGTQTLAGAKSFNTGGARLICNASAGTGSSFAGLELHDGGGGTTFSTTDWVGLSCGLNDNNDFNAMIVDSSSAVGYLRAYWSGGTQMRVEVVSAGSGTEKAVFSVNRNSAVTPGVDGTTLCGDTVVGGIITAIGASGGIGTADIADDAVTDAKLRESAGYSVIGRSASSTGNPADITAGGDNQVLMRTGGNLAFVDALHYVSPPASAGAAGEVRDFAIDANYFYVCTATSTWLRAPMTFATW